jgi:N-acyl-D-glutamate deacylase
MNHLSASLKKLSALLVFLPLITSIDAYGNGAGQVYDIVILSGRVIDPETNLDRIANVGINADRIAVITDSSIRGKRVLHAQGLLVAPGFIDLHSHGQSKAADRMQAFDGVTTALELESGILPIAAWYSAQEKSGRVLNYGASAAWTFARIQELENETAQPDLLWFQKAFALHRWVNDPATPEQVRNITRSLEQGINEGAIGIGINAGYAPAGGYKELMAVHALAAKYQVPTFTHISGDFPSDPKSAAESVGNIISMTVVTGSQSHICHINSSSLKDIRTTKEMILAAQRIGLPITTEAYTYGASSTTIGAALFSDEARKQKGLRISDIEFNGAALNDDTFSALRASAPGSVVVWHFLHLPEEESVLDESILMPGLAIASDGMPWTDKVTGMPVDDNQWPLSRNAFAHPRSAGTYAHLLAHWVRDRGALSMEEAIRKSSLIPAQILERSVPQMRTKGRLQVGMDADVIVFNPQTVADQATFTAPYLPSTGMSYVLVNGVPIIEDGKLLTNSIPGRPVRREITVQ